VLHLVYELAGKVFDKKIYVKEATKKMKEIAETLQIKIQLSLSRPDAYAFVVRKIRRN
jgi:hypothetical protein